MDSTGTVATQHHTVRTDARGQSARLERYLHYMGIARMRWYHRAFRLILRGVFRLFFRVRVEVVHNVPRTPVIICANHLGWADPFLVLLFCPVAPRIFALGLHPGHVSAFRAWVVDTLEILVPVDPHKPRETLRQAEEILRSGSSLLVFPEGTAVGTKEGSLLELQHGASHLSQSSGLPIMPVGLTGTSELWLRRTLTMRIGKSVGPNEFDGDMRTRTHAMTVRLEGELRALLPGDHERARIKPLRKWLTGLFF